jgi:hypothetical protein
LFVFGSKNKNYETNPFFKIDSNRLNPASHQIKEGDRPCVGER